MLVIPCRGRKSATYTKAISADIHTHTRARAHTQAHARRPQSFPPTTSRSHRVRQQRALRGRALMLKVRAWGGGVPGLLRWFEPPSNGRGGQRDFREFCTGSDTAGLPGPKGTERGHDGGAMAMGQCHGCGSPVPWPRAHAPGAQRVDAKGLVLRP